MNVQRFMSRINWRLLLIHFIASWFFIHSFLTLSYLKNTRLVDIYRGADEATAMMAAFNNGITTYNLIDFSIWTSCSSFIGLLVAFVISLTISIKKGWFWFNSLIVFIVTYLLLRLDSLGWTYLNKPFWYIGSTTHNTKWELTINGIILLTVGLFVFFFHKTNQFIEHGNSPIHV